MKSKTEQLKQYLKEGNTKKALSIAKTFKRGLTTVELKAIGLGYECLTNPRAYKQMNYDCDAMVEQAMRVLRSIYLEE